MYRKSIYSNKAVVSSLTLMCFPKSFFGVSWIFNRTILFFFLSVLLKHNSRISYIEYCGILKKTVNVVSLKFDFWKFSYFEILFLPKGSTKRQNRCCSWTRKKCFTRKPDRESSNSKTSSEIELWSWRNNTNQPISIKGQNEYHWWTWNCRRICAEKIF